MREKKAQILFVEDDPEFVRLVEHILRQRGYVVERASDAKTALAALQSRSYDALVLDYYLPDQNGLELFRGLAATGSAPPTIMLTGMNDEAIRIEALHLGIEAFLTKEATGGFRELLPIYLERALTRIRLEKEKHQAERELLVQHGMFRSLSECALDGIIVMDDQGKVLHWNPAAERLFGYRAEEVLGKDVHDLLAPPEHPQQARTGVAYFLRTGEGPALGQVLELEGLRRDGSRIPVELSVAAIPGHGVCRAVAIVRDISARKRMETELRKHTQELDLRLKELHCLFNIYQLLEETEGTLEETLTKAVQLLPSAWACPETVCVRLVLEDKVFTAGDFQESVWKLASPIFLDGNMIGALEVCYLQTPPKAEMDPFLSEERSLLDLLASYMGRIVGHIKSQQRVRELQRQIEFILEATHTNLFILDEQRNLLYVDPGTQRIYGAPKGRKCEEYFSVCEADCTVCQLDFLREGEMISREITLPKENQRPVEIKSLAFTDFRGRRLFASVMIDLTERKRIEAQLAQSQKLEALGRLATGLAHELNTPAQYVQSNLHFLQEAFLELQREFESCQKLLRTPSQGAREPLASSASATEDWEFLRQEIPRALAQSVQGVEEIATIVRAMKQFADPAGKTKQPVNLNAVIQSTLTICRNEWKDVAEVVADLDPDLPPLPGVAHDLHQVVLNLLVNAAQAIQEKLAGTPESKGTITISTRREGPWAELRISDTGIGIPAENRSKIFDPFFTTREVGQGRGQGLTIARAIVVGQYGGSIDVESEVGQGSTFIVRLPLEENTQNPSGPGVILSGATESSGLNGLAPGENPRSEGVFSSGSLSRE